MKNNYIGGSFFTDVKRWEKEDATFRNDVDEYVEKLKLASMLKELRKKEHLTQAQLAEKADISQSVIARIESCTSKTLPRLDLFNHIFQSVGYETLIIARKKNYSIQVALST